jgi:DNA-binding NtrC family response regulator
MEVKPFPELPVLLVDDEEDVLHSYKMALRYAGINNLILCGDSREVAGLLARQPVACMVLDLFMPHLTGQKLLPTVHQAYPELPVVVITGSDELETALKCIELGAYNYLVKPVDREQLSRVVFAALQSRGMGPAK